MNVVFDDSKSRERSQYVTDKVLQSFSKMNTKYTLLASRFLVGMLILILAKDELLSSISDVRDTSIGVGVMGMMGNKGAVAIRLNIYDTPLCFIGSHLSANKKEVLSRNNDYKTIVEKLVFYKKDLVSLSRPWHDVQHYANLDLHMFDHAIVFWFGDLNYRIDSIDFETILTKIEQGDLKSLLDHDQLINEMKAGRVFNYFEEGPLTFNPTYKYQQGTDLYEQRPDKKKREPAWCDRVLYFSKLPFYTVDLINYRRSNLKPSGSITLFIYLIDSENHLLIYYTPIYFKII